MIDNEKYLKYLKSDKWRAIAQKRMEIDGFRCVCCGTAGDVRNPLEIHHLSYRHLYSEETRIFEDLVTVCHLHHKMIHAVMNRVTSPTGRRGWADNRSIPTMHVFNLSGDLEYSEREEQEKCKTWKYGS